MKGLNLKIFAIRCEYSVSMKAFLEPTIEFPIVLFLADAPENVSTINRTITLAICRRSVHKHHPDVLWLVTLWFYDVNNMDLWSRFCDLQPLSTILCFTRYESHIPYSGELEPFICPGCRQWCTSLHSWCPFAFSLGFSHKLF